MSLFDVYVYLSQASVLLPIIVAWIYFSKLNHPFRVLFYFFLLGIGFEVLARQLRIIYQNNMPGLHLFTIVQFLMFSVLFHAQFSGSKNLQRLIYCNAGVALAIAVAEAFFLNGIWQSNLISRSYCSAFIIAYTLIYFYRVFSGNRTSFSRYNPESWFNIAVLIYFGNNVLYFMFRDYLLLHEPAVENLSYGLYVTLNIIAHLLYAQSFRCFKTWKTES